jgi:hypothetical protein
MAGPEKDATIDTAVFFEAMWNLSSAGYLPSPYDRGVVISKKKRMNGLCQGVYVLVSATS